MWMGGLRRVSEKGYSRGAVAVGIRSTSTTGRKLTCVRSRSMIPTYSDYIRAYVRRDSALELPHRPGEHHFVATYLIPRLYALRQRVPDFINPDGTKDIKGDIVYYSAGKHHFGIEVKFETVRLTKREFNRWVFSGKRTGWPDVFIGIGQTGFAVATWPEFQAAYLSAVRSKRGSSWKPTAIKSGYGPQTRVDVLREHVKAESWFPYMPDPAGAAVAERRLAEVLREILRFPDGPPHSLDR